jgi:hypothetical protein
LQGGGGLGKVDMKKKKVYLRISSTQWTCHGVGMNVEWTLGIFTTTKTTRAAAVLAVVVVVGEAAARTTKRMKITFTTQ